MHSQTNLMTFGGEARSGKGTSVQNLKESLLEANHKVLHIDQGLKFRALAELALGKRIETGDSSELSEFLRSSKTQVEMLGLLGTVSQMNPTEVREYLYRPSVSRASGQVGRLPISHHLAVGLLRQEVTEAVKDSYDTVLIDGRAMEKYGRDFEDNELGHFVMGWYFRCDAAIAARRSLGMFVDHENMNPEQKLHLLAEVISISDRNRSDALRSVDPMIEPSHAFRLDLVAANAEDAPSFHALAVDAMRSRMAVVNTSYTQHVDEMLGPVVGVSLKALMLSGGPNLHPTPSELREDAK